MLPLTVEWVDKAEGDWEVARREQRARARPVHDAVCFHAQQCAEKHLKARLIEAQVAFPPTHNLLHLLGLVLPLEPTWALLDPDVRVLTVYAVAARYPGKSADRLAAREALAACGTVRRHARLALGCPP